MLKLTTNILIFQDVLEAYQSGFKKLMTFLKCRENLELRREKQMLKKTSFDSGIETSGASDTEEEGLKDEQEERCQEEGSMEAMKYDTANEKEEKTTQFKTVKISHFPFESLAVPKFSLKSELLDQEYLGLSLDTVLAATAHMNQLKSRQTSSIQLDKVLQKVRDREASAAWREAARKKIKEKERLKREGKVQAVDIPKPYAVDPDWNLELGALGEGITRTNVHGAEVLRQKEIMENRIDEEVNKVGLDIEIHFWNEKIMITLPL